MTATNSVSEIPISSVNTQNADTTFKCHILDCPEISNFPTKAALEKHIEKKYTKPYLCSIPNCKHPRFGDKPGLYRHKREVHSSQSLPCPIPACKRHVKPFHRQYNVFDHMKRCHPQANRARIPLLPRPARMNYRESEERSDDIVEPMFPENVLSREMVEGSDESQRLKEKLTMLRETKAELDVDIQALERAVEILKSS